jgi:hypothetical protein
MNVSELITELQACDPNALVFNADGSEIDEVDEDGGEVTLFCEDDDDDDEVIDEGNVIDVPFKAIV